LGDYKLFSLILPILPIDDHYISPNKLQKRLDEAMQMELNVPMLFANQGNKKKQ